jgi:hypothetical protein
MALVPLMIRKVLELLETVKFWFTPKKRHFVSKVTCFSVPVWAPLSMRKEIVAVPLCVRAHTPADQYPVWAVEEVIAWAMLALLVDPAGICSAEVVPLGHATPFAETVPMSVLTQLL